MALHLEQGEGGARRTKKTGSHLDQGEGRARSSRVKTQARGGEIRPPAETSGRKGSKDNLTPVRAWVNPDSTPQRGGQDRVGHDRVSPRPKTKKLEKHTATRVV